MKEKIDSIFELINEVITGKNKFTELKKSVKTYFSGKEQDDFDKIEFKKLSKLKRCYDIIQKRRLSEVDKARLDYYINETPKKYLSWEYYGKLNEEAIKEFGRKISFYDILKNKRDFSKHNEFMAVIGEGLCTGYFHEFKGENLEKGFFVEIWVFGDDWQILILGQKKYKSIFEDFNKDFKN